MGHLGTPGGTRRAETNPEIGGGGRAAAAAASRKQPLDPVAVDLFLGGVRIAQQIIVPLILEEIDGRFVKGELGPDRCTVGRQVFVEEGLNHRSAGIEVLVHPIDHLVGEDSNQIVPGAGRKDFCPRLERPTGNRWHPPFLFIVVVVVDGIYMIVDIAVCVCFGWCLCSAHGKHFVCTRAVSLVSK